MAKGPTRGVIHRKHVCVWRMRAVNEIFAFYSFLELGCPKAGTTDLGKVVPSGNLALVQRYASGMLKKLEEGSLSIGAIRSADGAEGRRRLAGILAELESGNSSTLHRTFFE